LQNATVSSAPRPNRPTSCSLIHAEKINTQNERWVGNTYNGYDRATGAVGDIDAAIGRGHYGEL